MILSNTYVVNEEELYFVGVGKGWSTDAVLEQLYEMVVIINYIGYYFASITILVWEMIANWSTYSPVSAL